jgi:excisionase family DNA binding protein
MDTLQGRTWLTYVEAAKYCGLDVGYFRNQIKEGRGPSYTKPSERRVFFTRESLDRWMASWRVVSK